MSGFLGSLKLLWGKRFKLTGPFCPNAPAGPAYQELTPDQKRAIAAYVCDVADLLGFCLKTASEKFSDQVETEESLRSLATTLFIATQRHFGL